MNQYRRAFRCIAQRTQSFRVESFRQIELALFAFQIAEI